MRGKLEGISGRIMFALFPEECYPYRKGNQEGAAMKSRQEQVEELEFEMAAYAARQEELEATLWGKWVVVPRRRAARYLR